MPRVWTLDFETDPIDFTRPHVAPKPVGLAYREPSGKTGYLAWGHPDSDPQRKTAALRVLDRAYNSKAQLLFHNASFDLEVARQHLFFDWPPAHRIEDTRPLAFLANSYWKNLSLKVLGEQVLGIPPAEQQELYAWIKANVPEAKRLRSEQKLGAFIGSAPTHLVAPYAIQDVQLTHKLFERFAGVRKQFRDAYRLEISMLEVARDMTLRGVPVDVPMLERVRHEGPIEVRRLGRRLKSRLGGVLPDFEPDTVADALESRGWVEEDAWILTPKTNFRSLAYADLVRVFPSDNRSAQQWLQLWHQRQLLLWQLRTIVRPWLARVDGDGYVHVTWNTTRGEGVGARTGRLSSSPNLQNIGKESPPGGLPNPREFVRAPRGHRLVIGDLRQQEPRITAHFAGGRMLERFIEDPTIDDHQEVADQMNVDRTVGKTLNLAVTYALGLNALAERLGTHYADARASRGEYFAARPEVAKLDEEVRRRWSQGKNIVTWAGVAVPVELTPNDPGRWAYRALNTLVQRSAAEQLKAAMVQAHECGIPLILSVHDELGALAHHREAREMQASLERALVGTEWFKPWRVPFLADMAIGQTWRDCK